MRLRAPTPRLLAVVLLVTASLMAGCTGAPPGDDDPGEPAMPADAELIAFYEGLTMGREVALQTTHGEIRLLLYESLMPTTTARFATLVESGFYDGTDIHRIVPRFVIQGGDPSGTGLLGSGETIPHETHPQLRFGTGALGLARGADADSGDSQWFITLSPQPHLSHPQTAVHQAFGTYALYGQVIAGMDIAQAIGRVETLPALDRPIDAPRVESAQLLAPPQDIDLLLLPATTQTRAAITGYAYDLEHPLHLFATRGFPISVHLRPDEEADGPPNDVSISLEGRFETRTSESLIATASATLQPAPDDAWSFAGSLELPHAGVWTAQVHVAGATGPTQEIEVQEWHEEYRRFAPSVPSD